MTTGDSIQRFSKTVENYVKYRPTYPQAMVDFLRRECSLSDTTVVADIGSGTGLLARRFLENDYRVIGVEPNDQMRQAAQQTLKDYPLFTSRNGMAEATTLADQSVDLITVGQAFHWFEPLATRRESARILRAGGWVVLAWNIPNQDSPFMQAYQALEHTYRLKGGCTNFTKDNADQRIGNFYAPQQVTKVSFKNAQTVNLAGLRGRLLSSSFAPEPGRPEYDAYLNELEALFQTYQQGHQVTIAYDCLVYYGQLG